MKNTVIHMRTSEDIKRMVSELAQAEQRTVTNYIEHLIVREYAKVK